MPDLTRETVRAMLESIGLSPQDEQDLDEVTNRINALHEALAALEPPDLDEQEPLTVFAGPEARP